MLCHPLKIIHLNRITMKQSFFALLIGLMAVFFACNTQSPAPADQQNTTTPAAKVFTCDQLDNKQYDITVSTGGKVDGTEVLSFKNDAVESSECVKYGFAAVPYTCSAMPDGVLLLEMLMTSEKEGKMTWTCKATDKQVKGTILWVKAGQDDIAYTFEGPVK